VQSVPEPTRAICALGKRDISHDLELPQPLWWYRPGTHQTPQPVGSDIRVTGLNDQHAYVDSRTDTVWKVGDLVGFGVGHPCTTFDKWPLLYTVDDNYRVLEGIRTFF
jgi:D-serine dehydratase